MPECSRFPLAIVEVVLKETYRTAIVNKPHFSVSSLNAFLRAGHCKGTRRSVATWMYVSVCDLVKHGSKIPDIALEYTSTVSSTFTTPGCLKVRNFRTAFLAKGSRDVLEATSKVKMLQSDLSSCAGRQPRSTESEGVTYLLA